VYCKIWQNAIVQCAITNGPLAVFADQLFILKFYFRLGTGLSYSIVYSTLLVKLVFLVSLNSGVYLPATYQALLLCFAVLIQLVIGKMSFIQMKVGNMFVEQWCLPTCHLRLCYSALLSSYSWSSVRFFNQLIVGTSRKYFC
jgi:hypothetical protein